MGIDLSDSVLDGNYVDLRARYTVEFPLKFFGNLQWQISQSARNRKWVGYDPAEDRWDGRYVYVTAYGSVFHTTVSCSYLNPSVHGAVSYTHLKGGVLPADGREKTNFAAEENWNSGDCVCPPGSPDHGCLQLDFLRFVLGYGVDGAHRSFLVLAHGEKKPQEAERSDAAGV